MKNTFSKNLHTNLLASGDNDCVSISEASAWASKFLNQNVSITNISYLIQYGKIKKYGANGTTKISLEELKSYYENYKTIRKSNWKYKLGDDLNWSLSFDNLREKDTTKHVHRLHPYKGKFIPQLVEYFLDNHTDQFKKQAYFKEGDIILDPFAGSDTTLVQANELKMHAIGVDVSEFNCLITKAKLYDYSLDDLEKIIETIKNGVIAYEVDNNMKIFDDKLNEKLSEFNGKYFPSPEFKYKVNEKQVDENIYGKTKEREFISIYNSLIQKYKITLEQKLNKSFLDKWYLDNVRKEIDYAYNLVNKIVDKKIKIC